MQIFKKNRPAVPIGYIICIGLLISAMVQVAQTEAYVLEGPHILELMTRKMGSARRLTVYQKHIIYPADDREKGVELDEILRYELPGRFRSDIASETVRRTYVLAGMRPFTLIDGKPAAQAESPYDFFKDVLLYNSLAPLEARLGADGINLKISSLGRFEEHIAWVVGARYPDETVPQLWVDKETFQPLRWIVTPQAEQGKGSELEIRYHRWQKTDRNWYPMRIEFYHQGGLVRVLEVSRIVIDPVFSEDYFDVIRLESIYKSSPGPQQPETGPEPVDEVEQTIEEFKKIYH